MSFQDPVMVALSIADKLLKVIVEKRSVPSGEDVKKALTELDLEEVYSGKGLTLFRNRDIIVLALPRGNLVIDVIPSTGEIGEALEIISYHDRKLNALILEILPANDLEYEGNIGLEPAILDLNSGELKSSPVFGRFEEENGIPYLVIDEKTFDRWMKSGKLNVCPICGGQLIWKGKQAHCVDCGYGIKVRE